MTERVQRNILTGYPLIEQNEVSDDALAEISLILEMKRGFNMTIYKDKCMKRRISIRMRSCRCLDVAEYCNLLRQSDQEINLLQKALTIHVSQFFRNPSTFEKLKNEIIPELFENTKFDSKHFVFYSLGSAGGEEAYSLAIILKEFFPNKLLHSQIDIMAFDIDAEILQSAANAEYYEDRLKELTVSFRQRYFSSSGSRLQLSDEIKKMVTFHQRNIMDVGSFAPCQLILCRNTLIYFTRSDQEKILNGIAQILPYGGILVLGKSETLVGEVRKLFTTVCPIERIYRRL